MPLPYPDPELAGDLVRLRRWSYDDLACIEAAATDPDIPHGTTVPAVYSEEEGRAFIERQWGRQTTGRGLSVAIEEITSGEAVGLVFLGLGPDEGQCDLGYWLIPDARRRGLGSEAVALVSRWILTETDVHRLAAQVVPGNEASVAVLLKAGFAEEGILREWLEIEDRKLDVIQFSLLSTDLGSS